MSKNEERVHYYCPSGEKEFPIFELNDEGELVDTGKMDNVFERIQSFEDEVLLKNIIRRAGLTGETFTAPKDCFGDSRILPKSLLEAKQSSQKVQGFVDSLSENDLRFLNDNGFDAFIAAKLEAISANKNSDKVGDSNE